MRAASIEHEGITSSLKSTIYGITCEFLGYLGKKKIKTMAILTKVNSKFV